MGPPTPPGAGQWLRGDGPGRRPSPTLAFGQESILITVIWGLIKSLPCQDGSATRTNLRLSRAGAKTHGNLDAGGSACLNLLRKGQEV